MTISFRSWTFALCVSAFACSKSPAGDAAPSGSAPPAATPSALASAAPSATAAPSAQTTAWSGTYTAKVGAVEPPKAAKEKAWTDDPGTAAVGNGTLELSIVEPRGDTQGDAKGPLGDMIIAGNFDHDALTANLTPKTPKSADAMTGYMVLKAAGPGSLTGTLRVANRDARIVREASVTLTKK